MSASPVLASGPLTQIRNWPQPRCGWQFKSTPFSDQAVMVVPESPTCRGYARVSGARGLLPKGKPALLRGSHVRMKTLIGERLRMQVLEAPRYSKEEFARRGDEIYERKIRPQVTPNDEGKFALIDIETGDYEIDQDEVTAHDRLVLRRPDAQVWVTQVGSRYARRFGTRYRPLA